MMTKPKHTPGPWRVEQDTTLVWGDCAFFEEGDVARLGVPVADMCGNPSWSRHTAIDWDTRVANAHLTAASPTLYEALYQCRTDLMIAAGNADNAAKTDPRWEGVGEKLRERVRQADAALAAARGETP